MVYLGLKNAPFYLRCLLIAVVLQTVIITAPTGQEFLAQLAKHGFSSEFSSSDNFKSTAECVRCGESDTFGTGQALWAVSMHSRKKKHKMKAAWIISDVYTVVSLLKR